MSATIFCKKCLSLVYSENGNFQWCNCQSCYVDATPHYARYGGEPENIIILKKNVEFNRDYKIKSVNQFGDPYFVGCRARVFYNEEIEDIRLLIFDGCCQYETLLDYYEIG